MGGLGGGRNYEVPMIFPIFLFYKFSFQLMGRDKGGMEDSRLVSSFLDYASKYLNKVSEFPQIFVGVSDSKSEDILPSIARAILHTIKFTVSIATSLHKYGSFQDAWFDFITKLETPSHLTSQSC